jgi:hypothetical protein
LWLCKYPHSALMRRHWVRLADAVRRRRIDVARRVTAVGKVNVTPGAPARKVIAEQYYFGGRLGEVSSRIAAVIARFQLPVQFRRLDDGEIDGRKSSRSIALIDSSTLVFQGIVSIDVGLAEMAAISRLLAAHRPCRIAGVLPHPAPGRPALCLTCAGLRLKVWHLDDIGRDAFADIPMRPIPMNMTTVSEALADRVAAKGAHVP